MAGSAALPILLGAGGLALTGGIIYAVYAAQKRRTEALRMACRMMGFRFEETSEPDELDAFPLHNHGRSRKLINVLRGELGGRPATIGDYSYYVNSGKSGHRVSQTVVLFTTAMSGLPDFDLSPENVLHKLASVFGYQDIDFDTNEEFSKQYLLRGPDEDAIRRAFTPDALMLLAGQPGWTVQAAGGRLLVYRSAKNADPAQLPSFAADALRMAGALSPRGSS